jgi:hypothetical protein
MHRLLGALFTLSYCISGTSSYEFLGGNAKVDICVVGIGGVKKVLANASNDSGILYSIFALIVTISLSEVVYSGSVQLLCVFIFQPDKALPTPHKIFCFYFCLPLSPRPLPNLKRRLK